MNQRIIRYSALFAVCWAFLFASSTANGQITTSSITGTVSGGGKVLQGAGVVAIHNPTGMQYYATTDEYGHYSISDIMPGGPYSVIFSMIGFQSTYISQVQALLADNLVLNVALQYDTPENQGRFLRVKWSDAVSEFSDPGSSFVYNGDDFGFVPSSTGNITDLFALSPQVYVDGDSFSLGGADYHHSLSAFTRSVGVGPYIASVNDLLHLEVVDQISLSSTAFDVRNRGYMGTAVNSVLRRGTNDLTAAAYSEFRETNNYGVTVGGPIVRDKLFFFVNIEGTKNSSITFGRADWNITSDHQLQVRYHRSARYPGLSSSTFASELNSRFMDGRLTNVARASYSLQKEITEGNYCFISDDLTYNHKRHNIMFGLQAEHVGETWISLYLQDKYSFNDRLIFEGGVRAESFAGIYGISPRVGFNWDMFGKRWLVMRGGTGLFAFPNSNLWKSSFAFDVKLPLAVSATLEGIYGMDLINTGANYYSASARIDKRMSNGFSAMAAYSFSGGKDIDSGHSPALSYSGYVMRHRVLASAGYRREYANHFATTLSLLYVGGPQGRASLYYHPEADGNLELMDVPLGKYSIDFAEYYYTDLSGAQHLYPSEEQRKEFRNLIDGNKYLFSRSGYVSERNGLQFPWENRVDLKLAQEFFLDYGGMQHTLQVGLDIVNIPNLLSSKWGRHYTLNTPYLLQRVPQSDGEMLYHFPVLNGERITSLWNDGITNGRTYSFQVSVRYCF